MASGRERRWIIRLSRRAEGNAAEETMWYSGHGGPTGRRVAKEREDSHRFDSFPNAVVNKENLLSLGIADHAEIEEL